MLGAIQLVLRQAVEQPTKPTEITASDLLPFKATRSGVWQWFRLAKHFKYSIKKISHADFQRAYCDKRLADGTDPMKASVTYSDSSQGSNHNIKHHAGEEPLLIMKQKRTSKSLGSASESRVVKSELSPFSFDMQSRQDRFSYTRVRGNLRASFQAGQAYWHN